MDSYINKFYTNQNFFKNTLFSITLMFRKIILSKNTFGAVFFTTPFGFYLKFFFKNISRKFVIVHIQKRVIIVTERIIIIRASHCRRRYKPVG